MGVQPFAPSQANRDGRYYRRRPEVPGLQDRRVSPAVLCK
jgi:hypothetical protein